MNPNAKRGAIAFACLCVLAAGAVFGAGEYLSKPARRAVGDPPAELFATPVAIKSPNGDVAGWVARDRLGARMGPPGRWLAPMLLQQIPLRTDVPVASLRPVDVMAQVRCPVFVIGGALDVQTPAGATRRIFAASHQPKHLWLVEGAAHVDLHRYAGGEYERRIGQFLGMHLRP